MTFRKLEVREDAHSPLIASVIDFPSRMVNPKGSIEYTLKKRFQSDIGRKKNILQRY
ncbi:hypothetical protein LDO48_21680 [Pantoea agglomerans]|nr:hypothetical protein [Pantoea agglomerans]